MKYKITMVVLVALVIAGGAIAQDDGTEFSSGEAMVVTGKVSVFDSSDRNADGKISFEEYRNRMAKVFYNLDKNMNGSLSADELDEIMVGYHEQMDLDVNGHVSHKEFAGHTTLFFAWADSDSDGHLTRVEAKSAIDKEAGR